MATNFQASDNGKEPVVDLSTLKECQGSYKRLEEKYQSAVERVKLCEENVQNWKTIADIAFRKKNMAVAIAVAGWAAAIVILFFV